MAMPRINRLHPAQDTLLLICDEPLSFEALEAEADAEDLQSVENFTSAMRRRERLMWRRMLREEFGCSILVEYTPSGRPEIKNLPYKHISVSHCQGVVAVILSQRVCGIDVERKERNFERIAERYLTPQEWAVCHDVGLAREQALAMIWCAKECMYKVAQSEGVDLCRDVKVEAIDIKRGQMLGRVVDSKPIKMSIIEGDGYLVVHSC